MENYKINHPEFTIETHNPSMQSTFYTNACHLNFIEMRRAT